MPVGYLVPPALLIKKTIAAEQRAETEMIFKQTALLRDAVAAGQRAQTEMLLKKTALLRDAPPHRGGHEPAPARSKRKCCP